MQQATTLEPASPPPSAAALSSLLSRAERLAEGCGHGCDLPHLLAALCSLPEGIEALEAVGLSEEEIADIWARVSERAGIDPLGAAADVQPRPARPALVKIASADTRALVPRAERLSRHRAPRCDWSRQRRHLPACR